MRLSWIVFKLLSILFVSGCPSAVVTWLTVEQKNASKTYGILLSIRGTTVVTDFPFTRTTKFEKFPVLKLLEADLAPGIFFSCGLGILFYFFQSVTKPKLKYTFTLLSFFSVPKRVALRPLHYILRHYSYLRTFSSPLRSREREYLSYESAHIMHLKLHTQKVVLCSLMYLIKKAVLLISIFVASLRLTYKHSWSESKNDFLGNWTYLTYKS